jgi:tight adherence protein C
LDKIDAFSKAVTSADNKLLQKQTGKINKDKTLEKFLAAVGDLSPKNEQKKSKIQTSLMYAGYNKAEHMRNLYSIKVFSGFCFLFLYFGLGLFNNLNGFSVLFFGLLLGVIGYILPSLVLNMKIQKRQEEIASGLPDALDFLVICVEAGLGLNSALVRVGKELRLRCKALSQEILLVNQEMRTGMSRETALRNLTIRSKVRDLKVLAGSIILSDRLGTNIADTLRAQSDSLRTKIRQRAEEQAAKAGIKMLFPLVLFILPTLFIVILGPAVLAIIEALKPVVQQ